MLVPVAAAVLVGPQPGAALASACAGWTVLKPPSPGSSPFLSGVAVVPSGQAWAVGEYGTKQGGEATLLAHWNGTTWTQVPTPNPAGLAGSNGFSAVAATSSTNAWAVGGDTKGPLILHWNGTAWKQVPSPSGALFGVAATSSTNAWVVGTYLHGTINSALILHWNGATWTKVATPSSRAGMNLTAVTATSSSNAWAVGCTGENSCSANGPPGQRTLILHWNGMTWKQVTSPNPAGSSDNNFLYGVAATSATNAWAVGTYTQGAGMQTLIARWNGTAWKQVASPNPNSFFSVLSAVAVTSSASAWAVGAAENSNAEGSGSLVAQWDGTAWKKVPSPSPGPLFTQLYGVTAPSSTHIWAVGAYQDSTGFQHTLALRHC
jgi:hypothetical protein